MSTITPNMGLIESTVNSDSGLTWELNLNSSLTILDNHNHAPGSGVQISPAGLNINGALSFQNNPATALQACVFTAQLSLATLRAIYSIGADLYYNDANGNVIQLTSGGTVNATSSGISSGAASASFVASVLVVNAAANTPANIQAGSILLGNNSAASKFLTLGPPLAMAANYAMTLPALPAQTNVVTIGTSGTMASITYDAVGQAMTSVGANAIANTRTRATGSTVGIGGVAVSSSCGNFGTTGNAVAVTNLSVTITTSGRPVEVTLAADATGSTASLGVSGDGFAGQCQASFAILNGVTVIAPHLLEVKGVSGSSQLSIPASALSTTDFPAAGTYTYTVQASSSGGGHATTALVQNAVLIAYEL